MEIKKIGQGAFTRAFTTDYNDVLMLSCCPVKECQALGWFPESPYFEPIEFAHDNVKAMLDKKVRMNTSDYQAYKMRYLKKVAAPSKQLNSQALAEYKLLKSLKGLVGYKTLVNTFKEGLEGTLKTTLLEALDAITNFGEYVCFEISPRNIATDDDGRLILLDCFFMGCKLEEVWSKKRNKH